MPDVHDFGDGNGPVPAHQHPNGGGWVADTATVAPAAHVGLDARVYGEARVFGNASVYGRASVYGNASVSGEAHVSGNARVYGNASVYGRASVYGNASVSSEFDIAHGVAGGYHWTLTADYLRFGCETHSLDVWRSDVRARCEAHEPEHADYYEAVIRAILAIPIKEAPDA